LLPASASWYIDEEITLGYEYNYTLIVAKADGGEIVSHTIRVKTKAMELTLEQNYPNPFNPSTTISFTLPKRTIASLSIFNVEGRLVTTLVDGTLDEGYKEVTWDGTNTHGNPVSSGVYFYRLKAGGKTLTKKMVLLK
jgi:flagellar hook assembly protein FlgD